MTIKINTVKEKTDSELYNGCVCLKTLAYTNLSSYQKTVITKHWAAWNLLQSHWHQHIIRFVFNPYVLGNNVHFVLSVVLMDVKSVKNVIWVVSLLCNSFHLSVSKRSMLIFTYMFWILLFLFFSHFWLHGMEMVLIACQSVMAIAALWIKTFIIMSSLSYP